MVSRRFFLKLLVTLPFVAGGLRAADSEGAAAASVDSSRFGKSRINILVKAPHGRINKRSVYAQPLISDSPVFEAQLDDLGEQIEGAVRDILAEST